MQKKIHQVEFDGPSKPRVLRVAAYTRVSSGKDLMLHSLSQQVSYFSNLIQKHKDWLYCGVYADEALTGTKDSRPNFRKLVEDCKAGKVDLIVTKSISRFARNTVTLLETVRELKLLGIGVYFEEQNINTLTADGELMLTILASYAQEESLSASENIKWRLRNDFKQGILPKCVQHIYGYSRMPDGSLIIVPEEAEVVKRIFKLYLDGYGVMRIRAMLNDEEIPSNTKDEWTHQKVRYILSNEKYVGDLLMQKFYTEDHLTKKQRINRGELPQYYVKGNHEPIISRELFEAVQLELERRREKHFKDTIIQKYAFTGKIKCGLCGKNYRRKVTTTRIVWLCSTYDRLGKKECASKQIPEETLCEVISEVLGTNTFDADSFNNQIQEIIVPGANQLTFVFKDGHTEERTWKDRSRKESWTEEMKLQARKKALERRNNNV